MHLVSLPRLGTFEAWRDAARDMAAREVDADQITWSLEGDGPDLFGAAPRPLPPVRQAYVNVPKDFPQLARQLCAHRDAQSFDLAYRLLQRLSQNRGLMKNRADPQIARAEALAKNIRRDMHKMKAFVRFREVTPEGADRRQFVAWFEPDHRIEDLMGGFFTRRFGDMDWIILTPEVEMRFERSRLTLQAKPNEPPALEDETEELWRTYYANIFNPARLKIKAMQSEMPKKYWKNLPEAALIPDLVAQAEAQVAQMQAAASTLPPVRAARVLDRLREHDTQTAVSGIADLHRALRDTATCPWGDHTVQAVPGEGPVPADLMIVGEQPGDHEDISGRPFVGPAGQLFDQIATEVGLQREAAYVTNAVKHFKYQVRGKRRIHQSPTAAEVKHYRWWLTQEIALVQPKLILAMGATAALALTGNGAGIIARRGTVETGLNDLPVFVTLHPSALLRHPDPATREEMRITLRDDIYALQQMVTHTESKLSPNF